MKNSDHQQKSNMEKFLSLFTEVRTGEGVKAILLVLNIFLILTAYYIIKPVREALILAGGTGQFSGAVLKSIAATGQVILLMFAVPFYSRIASWVSRRKLINSVTFFLRSSLTELSYTLIMILFSPISFCRTVGSVLIFLKPHAKWSFLQSSMKYPTNASFAARSRQTPLGVSKAPRKIPAFNVLYLYNFEYALQQESSKLLCVWKEGSSVSFLR